MTKFKKISKKFKDGDKEHDEQKGAHEEEGEEEEEVSVSLGKESANPSELSASLKNFRHHPDMENFYRFIYENDLRLEALHTLDQLILAKKKRV